MQSGTTTTTTTINNNKSIFENIPTKTGRAISNGDCVSASERASQVNVNNKTHDQAASATATASDVDVVRFETAEKRARTYGFYAACGAACLDETLRETKLTDEGAQASKPQTCVAATRERAESACARESAQAKQVNEKIMCARVCSSCCVRVCLRCQ